MDNEVVTAHSIGYTYMINSSTFAKRYKDTLSDYETWEQKDHAAEWMLLPQNAGTDYGIAETSLQGELYTILHNKEGHGQKGSIIAVVKGTNPAEVLKILMQLPKEQREQVKSITMDLSDCMRAIAREAFPNAIAIRDCFHWGHGDRYRVVMGTPLQNIMNKRKILFIVPSRNSGGTNSSLSCIYNSLQDVYDMKVLTVSSNGNARYEFLNVAFTPRLLDAYYGDYKKLSLLNKLLASGIKTIKRISLKLHYDYESRLLGNICRKVEKNYHPDIIVGFQENLSTRIASFCKNPNKIAWIHCDYDRAVPADADESMMYSKFRNIVCVSKFTSDKFTRRYPSLLQKSQHIYNLLDIDRIKAMSLETIDDSRFDTQNFTIISVGRMDPVKRFSFIPQIAKKLKEQGLSFRWYIIGGPGNCEYKKVLESIQNNNVQDCVFAFGNKNNPYPYFKAANLYVSTSSSEACPMVFNEARIFGLPIVSTNFGSSHEFIEDNKDGRIEPLESIHDPISELIKDKKYYSTMRSQSAKRIISNEKIKESLKQLFDENA